MRVLILLRMYMCVSHYEVSVMWILVQSKDQTSSSEDSLAYCLVPGREYSVGRGACDLNICSQGVSSEHATISVRKRDQTSQVWIIDDSRFGTYVNSEQVLKSECQIFSGDEVIFGKWSSISHAYTYSLRWEPIVLCCSRSLSSLRESASKYNITLLDSWDDSTTHVVVRELRTTIKVLCGLSKGIPIVRQSWVDQLIRAINEFTPLPKPSEHMPDIPEGCDISDVSLFDVNLNRRLLFEGKTFYFLNIHEYEQLHIPISYCNGSSTLVSVSDVKFATFDRYAAVDSVVVSRKFDEFCSVQGGTEFISQLQLILEAEGKTIISDYNIIHSILKVTTDFISAQSSPTPQSQILEQYTTPPDVSDRSDVNTLEEDESLPQKKPKVDDHLFSNDQSTGENINELIVVNKNSSPLQSRKHLTELKPNQEDKTSLSAVPQLPKSEPLLIRNGYKVLRKCFVKHQPRRGVTYISPLVPYVSGTNELTTFSSEEKEDSKSESKKAIIESINSSRSQLPHRSVKIETTPKSKKRASGEQQSPSKKSTWIVIDSSDEEDTYLSVTPFRFV